MQTLIYIGGFYHIGFALFHVSFWKLFHWDSDLKKLSFASKAIMQILNIQLIYYFLFVAVICFVFPKELLTTTFGNCILGGISVFWLIRTVQQFIFLRANDYKIHLLTVFFLIGSLLFALPVILK